MTEIEALVEGGKADAGPPLGPALGPTEASIPDVVEAINERTGGFEGMEVPVKVTVEDDGSFEIEVGTPPVTAMIKEEVNLETLSGKPNTQKLADIAIEQIIKIAENKLTSLNTREPKSAVKQVVGTCVSAGVLIEGKDPKEVLREIDEGKYDEKINNWETEISEEKRQELEEKRKELQEEAERLRKEQTEKAEAILAEMEEEQRHEIVARMEEEDIPADIINEVIPSPAAEEEEMEAELEIEEE